ncbi:Tubulinyl-Tyr carboxypeptidase 1 [Dissostichus eleginoides]|uniref:Tubulinyl-Tyr carboxypeptidase 1 n=1 Tax=Dissostichus eleginoides TaxID=100907 RepID=A0AAD9C621_DISEL|nr:Tubulinyl-Tyr carboxypeptidase 1 [Dissostichus eleginoides]
MGKQKTKKFAAMKRMINLKDNRIKEKDRAKPKEKKKKDPSALKEREVTKYPSCLFFQYNTQLGPPYHVIVDTNFINFSIKAKLDIVQSMMDCLYAKYCVMAEIEKLGMKYRVALRIAKDPRFERLPCTHKGTYADDCLVQRHKCYILATVDRDLKRRVRKIPGVPIMYISNHRGGLPVDEETWERMWRHVARIHPNGEALGKETRGATDLPKIPIPSVPTFQPTTTIPQRLEAIQKYIRELQYNHTGTQFFEIKKSRPLTALMDIAKEMTREALPIKCLEAVILGIYLTNNMPGVERFPLSFQSHFSGNHFHHIVLGVHCGGRFGALGTSRREDLMFKPLEFRTLMDLVQEFEGAYRGYWHTLRKVRIGQYVSHDAHSVEQIEWKHSILDLDKLTKEELRKELERHTRDMRLKIGKPAPPSPTKDRRNSMGSPLRGQGSPVRRISRIERRPSGDKKVLEPKSAAEINGYQIRV